jgi:hypothetical protein
MKLILIKKPRLINSTNRSYSYKWACGKSTRIPFPNSEELFTVGKCYDGDLVPTIYDPQTLQPAPASYVVRCDDGYNRKVDALYFITLEEWRQKKLEELGI